MDIFSHGLWGGLAFGRKNRRSFVAAAAFGVAPDLLSFGFVFALIALGMYPRPDFSVEPPDWLAMPQYVHTLYSVTHSLVVFVGAFGLLWLYFKKPVWESLAWGLHILVDIPTHSYSFFPTPFLWPVSDVMVDGIPWASPWIFVSNVVLLAGAYLWFFVIRRRMSRLRSG